MTEKDKYGRITANDTVLLLIDVQEKFVPHIYKIDELIENCVRMAKGCKELGVPIIVTEQYPEGLGRTVEPIQAALGEFMPNVKVNFSLFDDSNISAALKSLGRPNLLLCGVEAHVCLLKTALDGLGAGYNIHWIVDAVSSRHKHNAEAAATRAIQCGAFSSSTEMSLFQMLSSSKDTQFRAISKIVK